MPDPLIPTLATNALVSDQTAVVLVAAETPAAGVGRLRAAVVTALLAVGGFFLFVGTFGLLRLPNVYNRLHATSKATTLGTSSVLLAGAVYFGPAAEGLTSLVGIVFLFVTAPTGAHMISRSARRMGLPFLESARWPTLGEGLPGAPGGGAVGPDPVEEDDAAGDPDATADGGGSEPGGTDADRGPGGR